MIIYALMHYGTSYENAAYVSGLKEEFPKEATFIFGDGRPQGLFDLAVSRDVVGHEYQHAVTSYSADLIYLNASGAINESYSDIFGALIQGFDLTDENFWLVGEDIINKSYQKALRDMKNPRSLSYPDYYKGSYFKNFCYINHDHYNSSCDNGGVHYNSSIVNRAAYEMYRLKPEFFTKAKIGELWYSTLLMLPQDAEFSDLRIIMRQAALALNYPEEIINTIGSSFDCVGVFGSEGLHTVTFDKGTAQGDTPATISRLYGEIFTIPQSNISKPDFNLVGWSENGALNSKLYIEGEPYKMPGEDLILRPVFNYGMWNGLSPTIWSGDGTFNNPYLIQSEADLATIAYYINNWETVSSPQNLLYVYYKQTKDLDLQNINWIPIGIKRYMNNLNYMLAKYDGDGHKIYNLKIEENKYNADGLGLFGTIDFSVKNLGIESGNIKASAECIGGIGADLFGSVENCYNKANIENTYENLWDKKIGFTAGVVAKSSTYIINCYNTGNIKGKAVVGGVTSAVAGKITDCYNLGNITGVYSAGGVFGILSPYFATGIYVDGKVSHYSPGLAVVGNCYNTGNITGENAGGIAGKTTDVYYANCINIGAISGISINSCIGGIVGHATFTQSYWSNDVISKSEGTMILGCKNTGYINTLSALYCGGIVGRLFDETNIGYIRFEKNTFKTQGGLLDIGNYNSFNQFMKDNFFGERAKTSVSNNFEGDFDFDNADYYNNDDIWAVTGWSTKFGIGYGWQIQSKNSLPVPVQAEYWINYRASDFDGGSGSYDNPYKIATAEQLALLAWIINFNKGYLGDKYIGYSNYIVSKDIDLSGKIWSGIGCEYSLWLSGGGSVVGYSSSFNGVFDGNNKKIYNMYARDYVWYTDDFSIGFNQAAIRTSSASAALFGSIGGNSEVVIKNIIIENCDVAGDKAAAIVGNLGAIKSIENCEIIGGNISGFKLAAGIVGIWDGWSIGQRIVNCYNSANVYGNEIVGGIVGTTDVKYGEYSYSSILYKINNCINVGKLINYGINSPEDPVVAAIIGKAQYGVFNISNCINTGEINNYDYYGITGGIAGFPYKATVNIYYCIQYGDFVYRNTDYSTTGALIAVPLLNGLYKTESSIIITNCLFNALENAVGKMPFSFEPPTVSIVNSSYSNKSVDFDFSTLNYFNNNKYLFISDPAAVNWMYARLNNLLMINLYKDEKLYQTLFKNIGDQVECLPHFDIETTGYGGWKTTGGNLFTQINAPFVINGDITAIYDYALPSFTWGDWETVTQAACASKGLEKHKCTVCGQEQTKETAALGHTLTKHNAVAPNCTLKGNIEYYSCSVCSKYYRNTAAATEITQASTEIAALGHTLTKHNALASTCTKTGNIEYFNCSVCKKYYTSTAAATEITLANTVTAALGHTLTQHAAIASTCTEIGNIEYFSCSVCGKHYGSVAATTEIALINTVTAALGHSLIRYPKANATCTEDGNIEFFRCSVCSKYYLTAAATTEITQTSTVTDALGHTIIKHTAVASTCTETGNIEYFNCLVCGKCYDSAAATTEIKQASTVTDALGHTLTHHAAIASTCTDEGSIEYFSCSVCGKYYNGIAATTEITLAGTVTAAHTSSDWIIDIQATVGVEGYKHRECTVCGEILEEVTIPAVIEEKKSGCGNIIFGSSSGNYTDILIPVFLVLSALTFALSKKKSKKSY